MLRADMCYTWGFWGCTDHTVTALGRYTNRIKVVVAYSTNGGGTSEYVSCNYESTEEELLAANIDVMRIHRNYGNNNKEEEQEAMMESLIKLGRLLHILE